MAPAGPDGSKKQHMLANLTTLPYGEELEVCRVRGRRFHARLHLISAPSFRPPHFGPSFRPLQRLDFPNCRNGFPPHMLPCGGMARLIWLDSVVPVGQLPRPSAAVGSRTKSGRNRPRNRRSQDNGLGLGPIIISEFVNPIILASRAVGSAVPHPQIISILRDFIMIEVGSLRAFVNLVLFRIMRRICRRRCPGLAVNLFKSIRDQNRDILTCEFTWHHCTTPVAASGSSCSIYFSAKGLAEHASSHPTNEGLSESALRALAQGLLFLGRFDWR